MKTWKRVGLAVVMMAVPAVAWGTDYPTHVVNRPHLKVELTSPKQARITLVNDVGLYDPECSPRPRRTCTLFILKEGDVAWQGDVFRSEDTTDTKQASLEYATNYLLQLRFSYYGRSSWDLAQFSTHPAPTDPPEPPEPRNPDDPTPPGPTDPETPPTATCSGCDHVALVPSMPRAIAGEPDAQDHWLRVTNWAGSANRFVIEGWNNAGTKFGPYRLSLPAHGSLRVKMRDIQDEFADDESPAAGWWSLKVTGKRPLGVVAMVKRGEQRSTVPVLRPATCDEP